MTQTVTNSQSFGKEFRILKRNDFNKIFNASKKVFGKNLVAFWNVAETDNSRVGLVVSKKVGNAVARNHVKRRIRESFRLIKSKNLRLKDHPIDLVVLAKSKAARKSFQEIEKDLIDITNRIANRIESK